MSAPAKIRYPRADAIKRLVNAAKDCGLDVAGFKVSPDGTIHIMEARAVNTPANDFERFQDQL